MRPLLLGGDPSDLLPRMLRPHRRGRTSESGFLDLGRLQEAGLRKSSRAGEIRFSGIVPGLRTLRPEIRRCFWVIASRSLEASDSLVDV